jgi:hypothetical protein
MLSWTNGAGADGVQDVPDDLKSGCVQQFEKTCIHIDLINSPY